MKSKLFSASRSELKTMRSFIKEFLVENKINNKIHDNVILAVGELLNNILEHGYNFIEDNNKIRIDLSCSKNEFIFKFFDNGNLVDIEKLKSRELEDIRPGGLGIFIIKEIFDEISRFKNQENWNNLLLVKKKI